MLDGRLLKPTKARNDYWNTWSKEIFNYEFILINITNKKMQRIY